MCFTYSIDKLIYYFYMIFIIKKRSIHSVIIHHFISFIDNLNSFDILKCFKIHYLMAYNHI